jgi:DNA-binding NarL/FixJ family response regulator
MHRMLGDFAAAERAYRAANRAGREPQPGLALLRLAQGDAEAAASGIRRALAETADPVRRARLLPAQVEIMVAVADLDEARHACAELDELAARYDSSALRAMTAHASGAVALAAGDAHTALRDLRAACVAWQTLDAPYEAARARLLLSLACRALGDDDGAALELDAARAAFTALGAVPDVARANALAATREQGRVDDAHGLTRRECEVLALVATGRTSRAIAADLSISEKTVARHLSNIYRKLNVSSRAAATAYGYEHGLVRGDSATPR